MPQIMLRGSSGLLSMYAIRAGFDFVQRQSNGDIYVSVRHDHCVSQLDLTFMLDTSGKPTHIALPLSIALHFEHPYTLPFLHAHRNITEHHGTGAAFIASNLPTIPFASMYILAQYNYNQPPPKQNQKKPKKKKNRFDEQNKFSANERFLGLH